MPAGVDFRTRPFHMTTIGDSGRNIGSSVYWKLYAIENLLRVIIHSVLTAQIGPHWWSLVADPKLQGNVQRIEQDYARKPRHSPPGRHYIYYVFLRDLNRIVLASINHFRPIIPDIDQWLSRLENIRLPRNIVGHMNWPNAFDRQMIDQTYLQMKTLFREFSRSGPPIIIP